MVSAEGNSPASGSTVSSTDERSSGEDGADVQELDEEVVVDSSGGAAGVSDAISSNAVGDWIFSKRAAERTSNPRDDRYADAVSRSESAEKADGDNC